MRVVLLAGGVGGAKLAHGLQTHLGSDLTVIVNSGDDLERHGLLVCPDHDTVMYTLAGIDNREWGWGIIGETFAAAGMLERYGEETWLRLGDRDLATHVVRSAALRAGERLTTVARRLQVGLGVEPTVLPMSDEPVRTELRTSAGWLEFQDYFVRRHQEPEVLEVRFGGIANARPTAEVLAALGDADRILVAPSNPIVSIGPIVAVPGLLDAVHGARRRGVTVTAVSGILAGRALKGPADRMLVSLGHEATAVGVARLYRDWVDRFVMDRVDDDLVPNVERLGMRASVMDTVMSDDTARARLAAELLALPG